MQQPLISIENNIDNMEAAPQVDDNADRTSLGSVSSSREVDIVIDLDSVNDSAASGSDPENNRPAPEPLVQNETRAIIRSKLLMALVLTLAATVSAYFTHRYIALQEITEFDIRVSTCVFRDETAAQREGNGL